MTWLAFFKPIRARQGKARRTSQDGGTKETQANAMRELNMVISLFHVALTKYEPLTLYQERGCGLETWLRS